MGDASPPSPQKPQNRAWVTLLTRASYLPGAILLAHSLRKQNSIYPLIILTTPSFPQTLLPILAREAALSNAFLLPTTPLAPPAHNTPATLIAARFADTWTKLRVFSLHRYGYQKLVFLDADMLVLQNMDNLFDHPLPENGISANHVCVCNLDSDAWAPPSWTKENCAYSGLGPDDPPAEVPATQEHEGSESWKHPRRLLNSGLFVFEPNEGLWERMLSFLERDSRVRGFMFPDQDFLACFFEGRWGRLGWEVNALKTWRYWHVEMWRDDKVRNLHYIVDKPWNQRVGSDGVAGYRGNDGVTHRWWWAEYGKWEKARREMGEEGILKMMRGLVAEPMIEGVSDEDEKKAMGWR